MSRRLEALNNEWEKLQVYIRQCPHLPSSHPLIEAALEGSEKAKETVERKIRDEHCAEFEWERFVEAEKKRFVNASSGTGAGPCHAEDSEADASSRWLQFRFGGLGAEQLKFLVQQTTMDDDYSPPKPQGVCIHGDTEDFSYESIPLFVQFLLQSGTKQMRVLFDFQGASIRYEISITETEDGNCFNMLPDSVPFQSMYMAHKVVFPNLARLLAAPVCLVKGLVWSGDHDELDSSMLMTLTEGLAQFGRNLQEVKLEYFSLNTGTFQQLVAGLSNCHALKRVELTGGSMDETLPTECIDALIREHDQLNFLCVQGDPSQFWPPPSDVFVQLLATHTSLSDVTLPVSRGNSAAYLLLLKQAAKSEVVKSLKLDNLVQLTKSDDGTKLQVSRVTAAVMDMFLDSACMISSLDVSAHLHDEEIAHFGTFLQHYTLLEELSLHLSVHSVPPCLCPSSPLQDLRLSFYRDSQVVLPILVLALNEQQDLKRFELLVWQALVPDANGVQLADALQNHPSLTTLVLGGHSAALLKLFFGALERNEKLQTLEIATSFRSPSVANALADGVPKAKHLCNLVVPDWLAYRRSSFIGSLGLALKQNLSICNVTKRYRSQNVAFVAPAIDATLTRNRLLCRATKIANSLVGDHQRNIQPNLWPHLLAKLGSNNGEATPVFALARQGGGAFACVVSRKRKLSIGD